MGADICIILGQKVVSANKYGKIATASFYVAIFFTAFNINKTISYALLILTVLLNLLAFANYFIIFAHEKDTRDKV